MGRGHDGHAENDIHDLKDARLEALAVRVLLQLADGEKEHFVIHYLANIVRIGHGVHRCPGIGVDEYCLRPVFFEWIAAGTQLNGRIHGSAPMIFKHESDSFFSFKMDMEERYQSWRRSADKKRRRSAPLSTSETIGQAVTLTSVPVC